jgi:hypothetical protein
LPNACILWYFKFSLDIRIFNIADDRHWARPQNVIGKWADRHSHFTPDNNSNVKSFYTKPIDMRIKITLITTLFLFQISNGQDTLRRFEFGSTLVTINSFTSDYYFAPDRPSLEFINGLFFRYSKKRHSLRIHASYSDNTNTYATPPNWTDGSSGDINNKDIRVGVGGQFSILKRKEWFYTFIDLTYRNVFSTGHYSGGLSGSSYKFTRTSNGFDSFFGLGFKIKTMKYFYLSPELGLNSSTKFVTQTTTPIRWGQSSKGTYTDIYVNPVIKLHLTVNF